MRLMEVLRKKSQIFLSTFFQAAFSSKLWRRKLIQVSRETKKFRNFLEDFEGSGDDSVDSNEVDDNNVTDVADVNDDGQGGQSDLQQTLKNSVCRTAATNLVKQHFGFYCFCFRICGGFCQLGNRSALRSRVRSKVM